MRNFFVKFFVCIFFSSQILGDNLLEENGKSQELFLSLDEKIGQLLMVHFRGAIANEEAKTLIEEMKVGSFIYYTWANQLSSPCQVYSLSSSLQKLAQQANHPYPLLIATDQEMGAVVRLKKGFTQFPGNLALAQTDCPRLTEEVALCIGQELSGVGIHMNLAPVIDVYSNPFNPIIGIRSFGKDPFLVASLGKKALIGYQKAGVIATLKHFPGHGDVGIDSHQALPVVFKSRQELESVDLFPFKELAPFAEAIMTAHLLVPSFDEKHCSTLSSKTLSYLRKELGFQGLIISDSLMMKGVIQEAKSIDQAAIDALKAGCDLLLLGGSFLNEENLSIELKVEYIRRIKNSIVEAVQRNEIPLERIDEALSRVFALKKKYCQFQLPQKNEDRWYRSVRKEEESLFLPFSLDEMRAHEDLAKSVANLSLKVEKDELSSFLRKEHKMAIFAPKELEELISSTFFVDRFKLQEIIYFTKEEEPSLDFLERFDLLLVFCYNAWKNEWQKSYIQKLIASKCPTGCILLGDPQDALGLEKASLILYTFSPTPCSIEAAMDYLLQEKEFFYTIDSLWRDL